MGLVAIWRTRQPRLTMCGSSTHVVPGCICRRSPTCLRQTRFRLPEPRQLPSILARSEVASLDELWRFTLYYELPRYPPGVAVRSLNLCQTVVMVKPQQEGVTGPWPQWQTTKEVSVAISQGIAEGRAEEQDVQRRLGWRGSCDVRARVTLRSPSRPRVLASRNRQVSQTLEGGVLRE
jgi:hypothetical protein